MADDGWLTTGRKLQLKVIFYGLLLGAATYTVIGLLNGFQYANQLIGEHPISVLNYAVSLIAFAPVYKTKHKFIRQILHQIGWSGSILLITTFLSFIYYSFNPPTTGIGRITFTFTKMTAWITGGILLGAVIYTKKPSFSED